MPRRVGEEGGGGRVGAERHMVVTCGYMGGALWPDTAQRLGLARRGLRVVGKLEEDL